MSDPNRNDGKLLYDEDGNAIIISKKCPQDPKTAPILDLALCHGDCTIWIPIRITKNGEVKA